MPAPPQFDPTEPLVAQDFARALQWAAMSFHMQRFEPGPMRDSRFRVDRSFYGLDRLPQADRPAPDFRDGKFDQAEIDFEEVRFQTEYVFGSRAVDYLGGGQDPFAPAVDAAVFQRQVAEAIGSRLPSISTGTDAPAAPSDVGPRGHVADALSAFQAFAHAGMKDRFVTRFGDINSLGRLLVDRISDAERSVLASPAMGVAGREAEFAQFVWPFSAEIYRWRLRFPASFSTSRTFPEYLEALTGLLVHYLRSAAAHSPDTLVECRHQITESAFDLMRKTFASSFVSTEKMGLPRSRTTVRPTDSVPRLPNFADLVARLCDAMMWGVHAEAARRLALQRDEPTNEAQEIVDVATVAAEPVVASTADIAADASGTTGIGEARTKQPPRIAKKRMAGKKKSTSRKKTAKKVKAPTTTKTRTSSKRVRREKKK